MAKSRDKVSKEEPGHHNSREFFDGSSVEEVPIPLTTSRLTIAMAQLEAPLPAGKTVIASHGRETFEWQSLEEINRRLIKAELVLDFLGTHHPDTNVVVFPEYSLAIREILPSLKKKAALYNQIIIPGADNMRQRDKKTILNRCPIILPNNEIIWITKRHLSQWETQYVDEPVGISNPVLTWQVDGRRFWIAVHICLDFTYISQDPLRGKNDPVIHIVPMCSPDNSTFRTYADTTLLEDGGRAVFLSNCVGEKWPGGSSLYAVTPTGVRLQPAYELTSNKEGLVFLELDCDSLVLPKRSTKSTKSPISRIHVYDIEPTSGSFQVVHVGIRLKEDQTRAVGVINPYLFKKYSKRMLTTFINLANYGGLKAENVQKQGFECYSVLGHYDMMVTHLHQDPNDLFFGIRQIVGSIPSFSDIGELSTLEDGDTSRHPYFEVETYHKVLGFKVGPAQRAAFREQEPSSEELAQILALGKNWNDENILNDVRESLLSKKWILGSTTKEPGKIDAVMTIYLDHPEELRGPLQKFEDLVLPSLIDNPSITSIYEGTGRKISIHYVLRITGSKDHLFSFIQEVHELSVKARLMIMTSTFVIVKKWSALDLDRNLLIPVLPQNEEDYRNSHIVDKLSPEDKDKFIKKPREYQLSFITTYRDLEMKLYTLTAHRRLNQQPHDMLRDLVVGLFNEDFSVLRHPHDELQGQVEAWLRETTDKAISDESARRVMDEVGIQKGKTKEKLTYAEWLLLAIYASEHGLVDSTLSTDLRRLLETTHVRNAIKHDEWSKLSVKPYIAALGTYIVFLLKVPQ